MKYILIVVALFVVGCATPSNEPIQTTPVLSGPVPVEVISTEVDQSQIADMMNQAERCDGDVKFQAEIENGKTRARFSCDWTKSDEANPWW